MDPENAMGCQVWGEWIISTLFPHRRNFYFQLNLEPYVWCMKFRNGHHDTLFKTNLFIFNREMLIYNTIFRTQENFKKILIE